MQRLDVIGRIALLCHGDATGVLRAHALHTWSRVNCPLSSPLQGLGEPGRPRAPEALQLQTQSRTSFGPFRS